MVKLIFFSVKPRVVSNVFKTLTRYNASMIVSKQVADFLTGLRGLIAVTLAWVGLTRGIDGLPLAAWLLLIAWVTDGLDGPLARRSRRQYRSWLGEHDLQIDMAVSGGLFIYLAIAGLIAPMTAGAYILIWAIIFARWGLARSLGMLVQAPIYGWFIWITLRDAREIGQYLVAWIVALVIITWPRFPQQVVPNFLNGMQALWRQHHLGNHVNHHAGNGPSNKLN